MTDYQKYFRNKEEILKKLEELHAKKYRLKSLLNSCHSIEPFITEFSGLPRTGKSRSIERIYEFFKMADIAVEKTIEPAQIIKESMSQAAIAKMSNAEFNDKALAVSKVELNRVISKNPVIVIQDRGVIDNYFWYQMLYEEKKISVEDYEQILLKLYQDILQVDELFIMFAEPEIIVLRDYINNIYLEDRTKTTIERVKKLKAGFEHLLPLIEAKMPSERKLFKIDTSNISEIETSIIIADKIMDGVSNKILHRHKKS